jgi:hypothetical protein
MENAQNSEAFGFLCFVEGGRACTAHRCALARRVVARRFHGPTGNITKQFSLAICRLGLMYKEAAMRSPHILVVEDDREIRAMVSRFLTKNGCRVTETGDAPSMGRARAARIAHSPACAGGGLICRAILDADHHNRGGGTSRKVVSEWVRKAVASP